MEVLLTLTLIALVVTPLMFQQSSILYNVYHLSLRAHRMFAAQAFLYEARKVIPEHTTTFRLEKKLIDVDAILTFSRIPMPSKSVLSSFEHVVKDSVTIAWKEDGQDKRDALVTFAYVTPKPEEKT